MQSRFTALLAGFVLILAAPAFAERTDELVLLNGNIITGEVKSLQQGKLKFKTDNAGTIYVEWEYVHALMASGVSSPPRRASCSLHSKS